jgi:hypothetical protein
VAVAASGGKAGNAGGGGGGSRRHGADATGAGNARRPATVHRAPGKTSIDRPRRAGRPIGQEAGRAGGATASGAGTVGVSPRAFILYRCAAVRYPYFTESLR